MRVCRVTRTNEKTCIAGYWFASHGVYGQKKQLAPCICGERDNEKIDFLAGSSGSPTAVRPNQIIVSPRLCKTLSLPSSH